MPDGSTGVLNASLVHVSVKTVNGNPKLSVYPVRHGDTSAFYNDPARGPATPGRPREVAWLGENLTGGMWVEIKVKPGVTPGLLQNNTYRIDAGHLEVHSGSVKLQRNTGLIDIWAYDVTLYDAASKQLDKIDPDIEIHPDP